jgi:hypothetical protein
MTDSLACNSTAKAQGAWYTLLSSVSTHRPPASTPWSPATDFYTPVNGPCRQQAAPAAIMQPLLQSCTPQSHPMDSAAPSSATSSSSSVSSPLLEDWWVGAPIADRNVSAAAREIAHFIAVYWRKSANSLLYKSVNY